MATTREQIEHFEHDLTVDKTEDGWWKKYSKSRKFLKKQVNRYMRRKNKKVEEDDVATKSGRKPLSGWEY